MTAVSKGQSAPENSAQDDDQLARIAIGQRAHEWRGHHVEQQKGAGEISDLSVGELEFVLHQRLHCKQHGTINVVQKVQRRQDDERGPGIEFALGHLAKEYNMPRRLYEVASLRELVPRKRSCDFDQASAP